MQTQPAVQNVCLLTYANVSFRCDMLASCVRRRAISVDLIEDGDFLGSDFVSLMR
jgi:hypothetical protein